MVGAFKRRSCLLYLVVNLHNSFFLKYKKKNKIKTTHLLVAVLNRVNRKNFRHLNRCLTISVKFPVFIELNPSGINFSFCSECVSINFSCCSINIRCEYCVIR